MSITAKNYAAQAERSFIAVASKNDSHFKNDNDVFRYYADVIKKAQHFAMPDGGLIFDDGRKGIKGIEIRLPYPCITIEYFCHVPSICTGKSIHKENTFFAPKRLILAQEFPVSQLAALKFNNEDNALFEGSSHLIIISAMWSDGDDFFTPSHISWVMPSRWDNERDGEEYGKSGLEKGEKISVGIPIPFAPDLFSLSAKGLGGKNNAVQRGVDDIGYENKVFFEFIEALSCKNVEFATIQSAPSKAESAKRAKKGKLPIYETKVLSLKTTETKSGIKTTGLRAGHASPRQHLRRGHIRRLESGNIWVNSCIVGDASKGVINKSYEVTK